MSAVTAHAGPNLALIKYFGKADEAANLPAVPSLGLTVQGMGSEVRVEASGEGGDRLRLDGAPADAGTMVRAGAVWDELRRLAGGPLAFAAEARNTVPTGAGMASSASGLAALAAASAAAAGLVLAPVDLARVARLGSGSAARACLGGWVGLGTDGEARALPEPPEAIAVVALIVAPGPKALSSREAMQRVAATAPSYGAWVARGPEAYARAARALAAGDLDALFALAEAHSRALHALLADARPAIDYATPATRQAEDALARARDDLGVPLGISRDAGANPFAFMRARDAHALAAELGGRLPGARVHVLPAGPGATRLAAE